MSLLSRSEALMLPSLVARAAPSSIRHSVFCGDLPGLARAIAQGLAVVTDFGRPELLVLWAATIDYNDFFVHDHQREAVERAEVRASEITRLVDLCDDIGCRGLLIHVVSEDARSFYRHLIPELLPSPTDQLHLVLLMKDVRRTLR
jgi:hypothetical protein